MARAILYATSYRDYEVQILVSAPNVQWPRTIRGVLHVGANFDDVSFSPLR